MGTGPDCGTLADQHLVYRYRGLSGAPYCAYWQGSQKSEPQGSNIGSLPYDKPSMLKSQRTHLNPAKPVCLFSILIPEVILPSAKDLSNGRLVARNMLPHNAIEKTESRMSDVTQVYSAKLDWHQKLWRRQLGSSYAIPFSVRLWYYQTFSKNNN